MTQSKAKQSKVALDWNRLLGFDQLARSTDAGKSGKGVLMAKVGKGKVGLIKSPATR